LALENELQQRKKATIGACALYALVKDNILYVANAGDCRAVMGKLRHPLKDPSAPPSLVPSPVAGSEKVYEAIPMSLDHNAREEREHARLRKAHPGEDEDIVLCYHGGQACYVKGRLQPSRAFGDIHLKLEGEEAGREGERGGEREGGRDGGREGGREGGRVIRAFDDIHLKSGGNKGRRERGGKETARQRVSRTVFFLKREFGLSPVFLSPSLPPSLPQTLVLKTKTCHGRRLTSRRSLKLLLLH